MPGVSADTTELRSGRDKVDAPMPRRRRTRAGKVRLLTLDDLDGRTAAAQNAQSLVEALINSLGGHDQLSTQELELAKRAALTGAIIADFEARWVSGQQISLSEYFAGVNVQRRVLATLGLQRRSKEVGGLSLGDLWRLDDMQQQRERERAAAAAAAPPIAPDEAPS
jgi:hypothetical protein